MNIVLLSGGSGKRLWPLSNDIRSKQFIKIFKKKDGTYESMVQRVYCQIRKVDKQVRKGRVTVEEAAEDAEMTVEEFKKIMENTPLQAV